MTFADFMYFLCVVGGVAIQPANKQTSSAGGLCLIIISYLLVSTSLYVVGQNVPPTGSLLAGFNSLLGTDFVNTASQT
jgi:uncharacterized membrane protein